GHLPGGVPPRFCGKRAAGAGDSSLYGWPPATGRADRSAYAAIFCRGFAGDALGPGSPGPGAGLVERPDHHRAARLRGGGGLLADSGGHRSGGWSYQTYSIELSRPSLRKRMMLPGISWASGDTTASTGASFSAIPDEGEWASTSMYMVGQPQSHPPTTRAPATWARNCSTPSNSD